MGQRASTEEEAGVEHSGSGSHVNSEIHPSQHVCRGVASVLQPGQSDECVRVCALLCTERQVLRVIAVVPCSVHNVRCCVCSCSCLALYTAVLRTLICAQCHFVSWSALACGCCINPCLDSFTHSHGQHLRSGAASIHAFTRSLIRLKWTASVLQVVSHH